MNPSFIPQFPSKNQKDSETGYITEDNISLYFNQTAIHSLKELRENFDKAACLSALQDGTLSRWLSTHYYEQEEEKISMLSIGDPQCFRKLCDILSVDYYKYVNIPKGGISAEEKRRQIEKLTGDKEVLENYRITALHQEDLAYLLNMGETKIYLLENTFSIPLSKTGITYIGAGNVHLENPCTKEQYEKAGITVQGISLPAETDKETEERAFHAALKNGYDPFSENHTPLATAFHMQLKCRQPDHYFFLPRKYYNVLGKYYNSRSECESAKRNALRREYDAASGYLTPGNSKSVSKIAADYYADYLSEVFKSCIKELQNYCDVVGKSTAFSKINERIKNAKNTLKTLFEKELSDEYYRMYEFSYFDKNVDIEEHDNRYSEDFLGKLIDSLRPDSIQYSIEDMSGTVDEMERDARDYANTFFKAAQQEYREYTAEIENLIQELGEQSSEKKAEESLADYLKRCCTEAMN